MFPLFVVQYVPNCIKNGCWRWTKAVAEGDTASFQYTSLGPAYAEEMQDGVKSFTFTCWVQEQLTISNCSSVGIKNNPVITGRW